MKASILIRKCFDNGIAILAAGASSRFGRDKLTTDLGGHPLITYAVDTTAKLPARTLIVTRPESVATFSRLPVERVIANPKTEQGHGTSVRLAAQWAIEGGFRTLVIMLADMPFVSADHVARLIAIAAQGKRVGTRHAGGKLGPPAAFPVTDFEALTLVPADKGARDLLRSNDTASICADAVTLLDVDTPVDLELAEPIRRSLNQAALNNP